MASQPRSSLLTRRFCLGTSACGPPSFCARFSPPASFFPSPFRFHMFWSSVSPRGPHQPIHFSSPPFVLWAFDFIVGRKSLRPSAFRTISMISFDACFRNGRLRMCCWSFLLSSTPAPFRAPANTTSRHPEQGTLGCSCRLAFFLPSSKKWSYPRIRLGAWSLSCFFFDHASVCSSSE